MKMKDVNAARKLLGWTKRDLAERAGVDPRTISNVEAERHAPSTHTLDALRKAFESAGIQFNDAEYPRLKSPSTHASGYQFNKDGESSRE
jgi:transcriptional regulator with XRE-family HTH domain